MSRYFFLHLHKTAGTALLKRLGSQFSPEEIYPGAPERGVFGSTFEPEHVFRANADRGDEIRLFSGHFPLCTTELLGGSFVTFTVLREPVERVLSALRHNRDELPDGEDRSFEEIYDDPMQRLLIRNHMTKMLALDADEMTGGAMTDITVDERRLQVAIDRLGRIDVVGLQSRFEAFCATLEERFTWSLGDPRRMNRSTPRPIDPALVERIRADNAIDIAVYDYATTIAV